MCSCRPGSHRSSFKYPPGTFYKGDEDLTDPEERKKLGFVQPEANAGDCKRPWAPTLVATHLTARSGYGPPARC
eukprot:COSAG04_NODE_9842_length_828_cov_0.928669_2_plen_74_part_00